MKYKIYIKIKDSTAVVEVELGSWHLAKWSHLPLSSLHSSTFSLYWVLSQQENMASSNLII